jgi:hypothetical protein
MGLIDSKSFQLRVRISAEERAQLEKLRAERGRGETVSDLVREAIALLAGKSGPDASSVLTPKTKDQVDQLAVLLKREPRQVEEACVEGILDLIEQKCEVPLIVMETRLHLKYHSRNDTQSFPWKSADEQKETPTDTVIAPAPAGEKTA